MGWAGFLSMALFRLPLWLHKQVGFWKLMGCGKNGTFDKQPDWRQWAILYTTKDATPSSLSHSTFINSYIRFLKAQTVTYLLQPIEGHGLWDGKTCFGNLPPHSQYEGEIAVLTRATIRLNKLGRFWQHVPQVAEVMQSTPGFITSYGIGEVPWIKQATFSIWQSKAAMKTFAYNMQQHADVVHKTRKENWYSEEMFVRFKVLACYGSVNPLPALTENL